MQFGLYLLKFISRTRGTLRPMPSLKTNKRRHPNNSVGMGKMSKINKRRAYCYSEVKSKHDGLMIFTLNSTYLLYVPQGSQMTRLDIFLSKKIM